MMESVPFFVHAIFILTALATVGLLLFAVVSTGSKSFLSKFLFIALPLWMLGQALLANSGFYLDVSSIPPRLVLTGVLPALILIVSVLVFFRRPFVESLPLRTLTLIHVVRVPVELVLFWLYKAGKIPQVMTFDGMNFDILSGILAAIVYLLAFRRSTVNKPLLVAFNVIGLLLLVNIVSIAVMSLPSPIQQMAFDQPNRAVLYFPYIWLPTVVVPIVLFSHLSSFWKLAVNKLS
jgi:hypothetical protein